MKIRWKSCCQSILYTIPPNIKTDVCFEKPHKIIFIETNLKQSKIIMFNTDNLLIFFNLCLFLAKCNEQQSCGNTDVEMPQIVLAQYLYLHHFLLQRIATPQLYFMIIHPTKEFRHTEVLLLQLPLKTTLTSSEQLTRYWNRNPVSLGINRQVQK